MTEFVPLALGPGRRPRARGSRNWVSANSDGRSRGETARPCLRCLVLPWRVEPCRALPRRATTLWPWLASHDLAANGPASRDRPLRRGLFSIYFKCKISERSKLREGVQTKNASGGQLDHRPEAFGAPVPCLLPPEAKTEWQRAVEDLSSRGLLFDGSLAASSTTSCASRRSGNASRS